jgi:hypothetical protein
VSVTQKLPSATCGKHVERDCEPGAAPTTVRIRGTTSLCCDYLRESGCAVPKDRVGVRPPRGDGTGYDDPHDAVQERHVWGTRQSRWLYLPGPAALLCLKWKKPRRVKRCVGASHLQRAVLVTNRPSPDCAEIRKRPVKRQRYVVQPVRAMHIIAACKHHRTARSDFGANRLGPAARH